MQYIRTLNVFTVGFIFISLIKLFSSNLALADYACLDKEERDQLRENVYGEFWLNTDGKTIYASKGLTSVLGFIVSNESHQFDEDYSERFGEKEGEIYVGFATTQNFSFLGAKTGKKRAAIFADLSQDVVMAMRSFYRPIWLVSESPQEWLANIAGLEISKETTIDEIFEFILKRNQATEPTDLITKNNGLVTKALQPDLVPVNGIVRSEKAMDELQEKLKILEARGIISSADRQFTMAIVQEDFYQCSSPEALPNDESLFWDACHGSRISTHLAFTYSTPRKKNEIKLSYLKNPDVYSRTRQVYLENRDYYAKTNISDSEFWKKVGNFSRKSNAVVTDISLCCIFTGDHCDEFGQYNVMNKELKKLPHNTGIDLIESVCNRGPLGNKIRVTHWSEIQKK